MVLIVRLTEPDQAEHLKQDVVQKYVPRPEKAYVFEMDGPEVCGTAAIMKEEKTAMLQSTRERSRLQEYRTLCSGIIDDTFDGNEEEDGAGSPGATHSALATAALRSIKQSITNKSPIVEQLMVNIQAAANQRHNVTILYRSGQFSTPTDRFFIELVTDVVAASVPAAEHALEIVADEIAKEKQMQRLMDGNQQGGLNVHQPAPPKDDATPQRNENQVRRQLTEAERLAMLSPRLRAAVVSSQRTRAFSPHRPHSARPGTANTARSSHNRYSVLSSGFEGALEPPEHGPEPLSARGLSTRPQTADRNAATAATPRGRQVGFAAGDVGGAASGASGDESDGSGTSRRDRQKKMARKSSVAMLKALDEQPDTEPAVIKNNGWNQAHLDGRMKALHFNGETSFVCVPGAPRFEHSIKNLDIDFWLKTDAKASEGKMTVLQISEGHRTDVGMLVNISLNWYSDFGETMRLYIRDTGNRVMEVVIPFETMPHICNGDDYHHFLISIKSLEEGTVHVFIDGIRIERLKFLQTEQPSTFNTWVHRVYLGGYVDEQDSIQASLRGSIAELRMSNNKKGVVLVRWPLISGAELRSDGTLATSSAGEGNPLALMEMTGTIPAESVVTSKDILVDEVFAPTAVPYFDGLNFAVNCGPLGPFGDFLNHWEVEFRFRTSTKSRPMSLIGVTDSQHKMCSFGVVVNAEPTPGTQKERYRYHEHHITLYITDCYGRTLSGIVRGSDRQHVTDGDWHTLCWRVVDAETNSMEVKIDGKSQDLILICRDSPRSFTPLRDWVCVGAHNVRSWKIKNHFEGYIKHCTISLRGEKFMHLTMDEGPGATIAVDHSGRHNHGLYIDPETNHRRSHDIVWHPQLDVKKEKEHDEGELVDDVPVVVHKNNRVGYALLHFGPLMVDGDSSAVEHITDLLHPENPDVDLNRIPLDSALNGSLVSVMGESGTMLDVLPGSCFEPIESMLVLKDEIGGKIRALDQAAATHPGHIMFIVKIGDACISVLGVRGPHLPPDAVFNTNMLKWTSSVSTFGRDNKRINVINNMVNSLNKVLTDVSSAPNLTRRVADQPATLESRRLSPRSRTAPNLPVVQQLQAAGAPYLLASTVYSLLVNAEFSSHFHTVCNAWNVSSQDTVAEIVCNNEAMSSSAKPRAAVMIQRNWRGRVSRVRVSRLQEIRLAKMKMVDELQALRRNSPNVLAKRALKALVITIFHPVNPQIPALSSYTSDQVIESITKQGYEITHVRNPTRAQLLNAVNSIDDTASNLVYVAGYGGTLRLRPPPQPSIDTMFFVLEEDSARTEISKKAISRLDKLTFDFYVRRNQILAPTEEPQPKRGRRARPPPPPSKKQQAIIAQQQRLAEENLRALIDELIKEETDRRLDTVYAEYESEAGELFALLKKAIAELVAFERQYRDTVPMEKKPGSKSVRIGADPASDPLSTSALLGPQQSYLALRDRGPIFVVPSDIPRIEPHPTDVVPIEELVNASLMSQLTPHGFQGTVIMDLVPLTRECRGIGVVAASTGHCFTFPYKKHQRDLVSIQLRKAMLGYPVQMPIKNMDALFLGGVDAEEGTRQSDWRSFANYLCPRVARNADVSGELVGRELHREVPYTADLVPVRKEVLSHESRDKSRRDREMKRIGVAVTFAIDSMQVTSDVMSDLKPLIPSGLVNISDVGMAPRALVSFADGNRGIDAIDLEAVQQEVDRCAAPGVTANAAITADGILISVHAEEKSKITITINSVAQRSATWSISSKTNPPKPFQIAKVEQFFTVRGTGNLRKYHQLNKHYCQTPVDDPWIRFIDMAMD